MRNACRVAFSLLPLFAVACGSGGGRGAPISGSSVTPDLVFCRWQVGQEQAFSEVRSATRFGLGPKTVSSAAGSESGVRVSPDGKLVAFARERRHGDPETREIYVATLDASEPEVRLTSDGFEDDGPCWSPDGKSLLFSSNRAGGRSLWRIDTDGSNLRQFTSGPDDREPDWAKTGNLIVFARKPAGTNARYLLHRIAPDGSGLDLISDGGGSSPVQALGDREPAISPDGTTVLFARVYAYGSASVLMATTTAPQGVAKIVSDALGEDRMPRWSPRGDRIYCAMSRKAFGLDGLRLWALDVDGSDAALVLPDLRYSCQGLDPVPGLAAWVEPGAATEVPLDLDQVAIAAGQISAGSKGSVRTKDGVALGLATEPFQGREVAGLNVRVRLPVAKPEDVLALEIQVSAALTRADGDTAFRVSVFNAPARRQDTVIEAKPAPTSLTTYTFRLQSHAHLDSNGQVEFEIVGDFAPGARAELAVDQIAVRFRTAR